MMTKDTTGSEVWRSPISRGTEEAIIRMLGQRQDFRLLDFGAGFGRYCRMFSKYTDKDNIVAMETDERGVQEIRRDGFTCIQVKPDKVVFPFRDCCFDVVFSSNVVEHLSHEVYIHSLQEINRILVRGGRFLIGTPNYPWKRLYDIGKAFRTKRYRYYLLDDPGHINKLSIRQLERDLRRHFRVVHLEPTHVAFEHFLGIIRRNRLTLKVLSDKVFGYCEK